MRATISGYGMSIELPSGWTGRIFKRDALSAAVLRAANFPLYLGTSMALASVASDIRDGGIFIEVSDLELPMPREPWEGWSRETAPIEVRRSDFGRYEGTVAPGFALRNVVVNGRSLMIGVGFATPAPDDALLARANQLLGSLRVAADGTAWGGEDAHDAPAVWFAHRDGWFTAETSLAGPDNSPIPVAWEGNTPFLDAPQRTSSRTPQFAGCLPTGSRLQLSDRGLTRPKRTFRRYASRSSCPTVTSWPTTTKVSPPPTSPPISSPAGSAARP
jgi:hypothetical protein